MTELILDAVLVLMNDVTLAIYPNRGNEENNISVISASERSQY